MSGGFFRGTSADQDTRFSNKQAKLLKSQKFPSELEHPMVGTFLWMMRQNEILRCVTSVVVQHDVVDMTKVKLDIMRPWIANRVTELLGFEDEVLINFVYGLLDGKDVDGKQVQIQLTGFMEKNTGKFMKELWSLLLSAQNNASGVPQQFLDAKEEEMKKKMGETERIAQEIQRRREREGRDLSRMGAEVTTAKSNEAATDLVSKRPSLRTSDEKIIEEIKRSSRSSRREGTRSRSSSVSSKSPQRSPPRRRHRRSPAISSSSPVRSISPRRKRSSLYMPSPPRRRSPFGQRRSTSRPRHRSPSPRRRSPPMRHRSPSLSPVHRRSGSPVLRRSGSPARRRSPLTIRRRTRSPLYHRSPSPQRRRSSPSRGGISRSGSPARRRSPLPIRRRTRSPLRHRSPSPLRRRSSPSRSRISRSPLRRRSPSPKLRSSTFQVRRSRSPLRRRFPVFVRTSVSPISHSSSTPPRRFPESRSPTHRKRSASPSPKRRPADSRISSRQRNRSQSPGTRIPLYRARRSLSRERAEDIRTNGFRTRKHQEELLSESSFPSPNEQSRKRVSRLDSPEASKDNQDYHERGGAQRRTRNAQKQSKRSPVVEPEEKPDRREEGSSDSASHKPYGTLSPTGVSHVFIQQKEPRSCLDLRENSQSRLTSYDEYRAGGRVKGAMGSIDDGHARHRSKKQGNEASAFGVEEFKEISKVESAHRESLHAKDGSRYKLEEEKEGKDSILRRQPGEKSSKIGILGDELDGLDSDSKDAGLYNKKDKRKHKKSSHHKKYSESDSSDDDGEYDFRADDKKEARRRKKEERKKRREEKRQRREERHRRRSEGRGSKPEGRLIDTVAPPLDLEKNYKNNDEAADDFARREKRGNSQPSDVEMESEQKRLEVELRKKALDSLRAKKAINR